MDHHACGKVQIAPESSPLIAGTLTEFESNLESLWNEALIEPEVIHLSLQAYRELLARTGVGPAITPEMEAAGMVTITKDGVFPNVEGQS